MMRDMLSLHYVSVHNRSRQNTFQELQQKGVDRQTIQSAWEEAEELETPDEHALLVSLIEKRYPEDSELDEREMRRLMGTLQDAASDRARSVPHWKN